MNDPTKNDKIKSSPIVESKNNGELDLINILQRAVKHENQTEEDIPSFTEVNLSEGDGDSDYQIFQVGDYSQPCNEDNITCDSDASTEKSTTGPARPWDRRATYILINLYKKFRRLVGSKTIRTQKKMWVKISAELRKKHNLAFSPPNCENRWRVLERNYKKATQLSREGSRRHFEYAEEMDAIHSRGYDKFSSKLNKEKNSATLQKDELSKSLSIYTLYPEALRQIKDGDSPKINEEPPSLENNLHNSMPERRDELEVLNAIREDFKQYHSEMLKVERLKLMAKKRNNDLKEERNQILQKLLDRIDSRNAPANNNLITNFVPQL